MRLTARVPATSANLGPGFDSFGLALDLCNEVTVDTDAEPGVIWQGEGAEELPTDGSDLVTTAIRHVALRVAAGAPRPVPTFRLHGVNRIPLERGLGSSSAAAVAGVALAYVLLDLLDAPDPYTTFSIAAALEGHPDNAAAAAFGGFTIVAGGDLVRRFDPHPALRPAVLVPMSARVVTEESRRRLPPEVSRDDAVFNIGHAALTTAALLQDPDLLYAAMRDRLHEAARLALVPDVAAVFELVRAANVPVCVSGSGPALLAFERDWYPVPDPGNGWRVLRVPVRATGVEVART